MCGRYYVDDGTAREIEKLVHQVDERKRRESLRAVGRIAAGDVFPGKDAPVLSERDGSIRKWQSILKNSMQHTKNISFFCYMSHKNMQFIKGLENIAEKWYTVQWNMMLFMQGKRSRKELGRKGF